MSFRRTFYPAVFFLGLLGLGGCLADQQVDDSSAPQTPTYVRMSTVAPPEPKSEDIPVSEKPWLEIWRPGYWAYLGGNFDWVPGQMMPRPSPTAVWSPDRWVKLTYGWAFEPGYWQ